MSAFLPLVLIGLWKPKLGWKLLLLGMFASVMNLAVVTDFAAGSGLATLANVLAVGLPMVAVALVLLLQSRGKD